MEATLLALALLMVFVKAAVLLLRARLKMIVRIVR